MTKYQVFRKSESAGPVLDEKTISFTPIGEYDGNDAKGAVKAAILAMAETDRAAASTQTFGACASSAWQVLTPKVNVETTVSFA